MSDSDARLFAATLRANEQLTPIARKALDQYLADTEGVMDEAMSIAGSPGSSSLRPRLHALLLELVEMIVREVAADPTRSDPKDELSQMVEAIVMLGRVVWNDARSKTESTDGPQAV